MEKKEKIERYLLKSLFQCLSETFGTENRHADKAMERYFRFNRKWGARDRRFFAENLYDIVRWWRKLTTIAQLDPDNVMAWTDDDWQDLWSCHNKLKSGDISSKNKMRAIQESIPDWLDDLGYAEMGLRWDSILHSLNLPAPVDLRVNLTRISREDLVKKLAVDLIETSVVHNSYCGLTLKERKNVFATASYKDGLFEVQDRSSQRVAEFLDPKPGARVIDACAGAGGKTLHIGDLMKNRGQIISLDINERKLTELKIRSRRAQLSCVETRLIDSTKVIKRLESSATHLLLDVPCSGLGVLRRNPDTKWKLKPESLAEVKTRQNEILASYSRMLKAGGTMVYSTCSILPSENEQQVDKFLKANPKWEQVASLRIDPDQGQGDGFFAAKLQLSK